MAEQPHTLLEWKHGRAVCPVCHRVTEFVWRGEVLPKCQCAHCGKRWAVVEGHAGEQSGATGQQPSQAVRLQRVVSLHARWLEEAAAMREMHDEDAESVHAEAYLDVADTLSRCAREMMDATGAGMEANDPKSATCEEARSNGD